MADIGLDRADSTETGFVCPATESLRYAFHLYRITQNSGRAVHFDISDRGWINRCRRQRLRHDGGLTIAARGEKAHFLSPIIVERRPFDHRVNRIAIPQGILQPL